MELAVVATITPIAVDPSVAKNAPIEIGAHGAWTKTVRRMRDIDAELDSDVVPHVVTGEYALRRMTHQGRAGAA